MKKLLSLAAMLLVGTVGSTSAMAASDVWIEATPSEVHIVPEGVVLRGFDITGIACASISAVRLLKTDPQYREKLSSALSAQVSGKVIKVMVPTANHDTCVTYAGLGAVPTIGGDIWVIK